MSVKVENQEYFDWRRPTSNGLFDGKDGRYAKLAVSVGDDGLTFELRKYSGSKTDFLFTLSESDAASLYEMLKEHFES